MLNETEIKIKIAGNREAKRLLETCARCSEEPVKKEHHKDEYYDTKQEELRNKDLTVRIRNVNGRIVVALKSPRIFITDKIQKRIELEFEASDGFKLRKKIYEQGLILLRVIEKRRWNFIIHGCDIAIDEVPFIGWFIEIEGRDSDSIYEIIKLLNLSTDEAVKEHYGELIESQFRIINRPIRSTLKATFAEFIKWKKQNKSCN